ncbi:hypothetical protein PS838_01280 [Pseudomonas fluorescens]|nr:hypothetical protein PS838_01280 [Pseudomonas fluorescens]
MDFNDNAFLLNGRVALETIASELAPTGFVFYSFKFCRRRDISEQSLSECRSK